MKCNLISALVFAVLLAGCQREKAESNVVFDNMLLSSSTEAAKLSDMLGGCRLVGLETNDSCLIGGRTQKYVKRDSVFYVMASNEILEFDNQGRFLRKLSRVGGGPDDYTRIDDFEIVPSEGGNQIWVADLRAVKKYDAETLGFLGTLEREGGVNQIKYVNDSTILLTTPDELRFHVLNRDGQERGAFYDKDYPNGLLSISQYFGDGGGGSMAWLIENHNQAAVYNPSTGSFAIKTIFPDLEGTSDIETNREYFDKYGDMEFSSQLAKNFSRLMYVNTHDDDVIWLVMAPSRELTFYSGNTSGRNIRHALFDMRQESPLNDVVATTDMRFILTPCATSSDAGFLFILDADELKDADPESNPSLLEVTTIPD